MKCVLKTLAAALALAFVAGAQADVTYENSIRKLITEGCAKCHGKDAPTMEEFKKDQEGFKQKVRGPRMESYEEVMVMVNGSDTGAMMRRLDDGTSAAGKAGNMYKYLGKNDADRARNLATFKEWVGHWTLKRRKDIGEDELKKIKAPER